MTEPDDPDRLTIPQAAVVLQVSTRTVEQLIREGKLDPRRWRPSTGGQWRTVLLASDVRTLAAERAGGPPRPFLVRDPGEPSNGNGHQAPASSSTTLQPRPSGALELPSGEDVLRLVFAMAHRALLGDTSAEAPKEDPKGPKDPNVYLTLAEASAEKRVSVALIRRWMRTGKLSFEREPRSQWTAEDWGHRIRRKDLESL